MKSSHWLSNRAFNLPSTTDGKSKEIQHVTNASLIKVTTMYEKPSSHGILL